MTVFCSCVCSFSFVNMETSSGVTIFLSGLFFSLSQISPVTLGNLNTSDCSVYYFLTHSKIFVSLVSLIFNYFYKGRESREVVYKTN